MSSAQTRPKTARPDSKRPIARPAPRPVARPVARPAPRPVARPVGRPVAGLKGPAKRVATAGAGAGAGVPQAKAAGAAHFAALHDAPACGPAVCGNSISFCVTIVPAPCFQFVPADGVTHVFSPTVATCETGVFCNVVQCSQQVSVDLDNPCNPGVGDTIQCLATVALNQVYLSGAVATKVSLPVYPIVGGCGVAWETVDFSVPVENLLVCVTCAEAACPERKIVQCQIDCVVPLIQQAEPPVECPEATPCAGATAYAVYGTIFFGTCGPCTLCPEVVVTQVSPRGVEVIADESGPTSFNGDGIGWNFDNVNGGAADKINWYKYINDTPDLTATYGSLALDWARVQIHNCAAGAEFPFFVNYSARLNDGKDAGSFYRSRGIYEIAPADVVCGEQVILYTGADPVCYYPELKHIQLQLTNFVGPVGQVDFLPGELMLALSLQTNSSAATGDVSLTAYTLGYQIGAAPTCEQLDLRTVVL